MLSVDGRVEVRCTLDEAWELFSRFGDVAALIPSVEEVEVDGDLIHARVATKLGALPVTSRVTLKVVERRERECLRAEGLSYLGETIKEQIKKNVKGVAEDSVGRMKLHLDLRPSTRPGHIEVIYVAEVEAKGRLKRIYQTILKTKVPGLMEQFAQNIRCALEQGVAEAAEVGAADAAIVEAPLPVAEAAPSAGIGAPRSEPPPMPGLWVRFVSWLRAVLRTTGRAA